MNGFTRASYPILHFITIQVLYSCGLRSWDCYICYSRWFVTGWHGIWIWYWRMSSTKYTKQDRSSGFNRDEWWSHETRNVSQINELRKFCIIMYHHQLIGRILTLFSAMYLWTGCKREACKWRSLHELRFHGSLVGRDWRLAWYTSEGKAYDDWIMCTHVCKCLGMQRNG